MTVCNKKMNRKIIYIIGGENGQVAQVLNNELFKRFSIIQYPIDTRNIHWYKEKLVGTSQFEEFVDSIEELYKKNGYDWFDDELIIVNTAAISDTRYCEKEWQKSMYSNVNLPLNLINEVKRRRNGVDLPFNFFFIHISTGCIFDGNNSDRKMGNSWKGISEDYAPTPLINYSKQKHFAEVGIQHALHESQYCIIRPRMLFSDIDVKSNLLWKINNFTELIDENNSMTCAYDLANFIIHVILHTNNIYGVYNFCNEGTISPYRIKELMNQIVFNDSKVFEKITKQELFAKTNIKLTDTIIDSSKASVFFMNGIPRVENRITEILQQPGMQEWLKKKSLVSARW